MLLPTPMDLRTALSRYADAVIDDHRHSTSDTARRHEDTAYTLCIMTGANEVRRALAIADALLRTSTPAAGTAHGDASQPADGLPNCSEALAS
ncbi:DUF5133 domain-containing protein [Streptomyces sp. NPDC057900]|uniref:DUF5133 domain-containing protein n=1 Tax=Streptomyces sp. NPDC057900 TaxID=3346274 RepID=UPI0036EA75C9